MDRDLEGLVDRLNELERQNRRLRRAGLVILIGLAALLVMGQARTPRIVKADEVVAHKLTLRDDHGRPVAVLDVTKEGPGLVLGDAASDARAALLITEDGPALILRHGKSRANLWLLQDGPSLKIVDAEGFETVVGSTDLVTDRTGEQRKRSAASAVMFNNEGKVIWSAP